MFVRSMAFVTRSLRQESRLISHYIMRGVLALFILMLFCITLSGSGMRTGAGAEFVFSIVWCSYAFLSLAGAVYFSTAIVEEKEEQTLPLLRMTGVSTFGLLIGKSVPRLTLSVLFLLVISPFLLLALTVGGVTSSGILLRLFTLLTYSFLLSQLGLLSGALCRNSRSAFAVMVVFWAAVEVGGWVCWGVGSWLSFNGYGGIGGAFGSLSEYWVGLSCLNMLGVVDIDGSFLLEEIQVYLADGEYWPALKAVQSFLLTGGGRIFVGHVVLGVSAFLVSWLLFEPLNRHAIAGGAADKRMSPVRVFKAVGNSFARVGGGRCSQHPFAWKSWTQLTGGFFWIGIRCLVLAVTVLSLVLFFTIGLDDDFDAEVLAGVSMFVGVAFFVVESGRNFGRVIPLERSEKTLATLAMIPRSTGQLLRGLFLGVIPALIPSFVCFFGGLFLMALCSARGPVDFVGEILEEVLSEPWFWHFFTWYAVTVVVGVVLTAYMRFGGMLMSVAFFWMAGPMMFGIVMGLVATAIRGGAEELFRYVLPMGLMMAEVAICFAAATLLIRRVEELASEG